MLNGKNGIMNKESPNYIKIKQMSQYYRTQNTTEIRKYFEMNNENRM